MFLLSSGPQHCESTMVAEATNDYIVYCDYIRYIPTQVPGVSLATLLKKHLVVFVRVG